MSRPNQRKQYRPTAATERRGVALCHSIVTEMGHIWREKGVDYGIDGEIELVYAGTVLGRVLWVQVKATTTPEFAEEDERGFTYTCRQVDLDYWLGGTAPVLLVCCRPDTKQAWFKDIQSWFSEADRRRDRKVRFDKATDRFDAGSGQRLLKLGADPAMGLYLAPTPRHEVLTTNLLTIEHLGARVFHAPTSARRWQDARPRLVKAGAPYLNDLVFHRNEAWSLRRFDEPPLDCLASGPMESIDIDELTESADPNDQRLLTWILNATLADRFGRDLRSHRDPNYLYFKAPPGQSERRISLAGRRGRGRTVTKRYAPGDDDHWQPYTRHFALSSQFQLIGGAWHLSLIPTYHYSNDEGHDSSFGPQLLAGIKRREGHEAIRALTSFWAKYLGQEGDLFSEGSDPRLRFGRLATVDVERGIDDGSWKPLTTDEVESLAGESAHPTLFDFPGGA
jgi:hypothetical protein